jgi:hypothetical protein
MNVLHCEQLLTRLSGMIGGGRNNADVLVFIELGKKKMAGNLTGEEDAERIRLLESRPDLKAIYELVFNGPATSSGLDRLEAEKAYAVHFVKKHPSNKFNP